MNVNGTEQLLQDIYKLENEITSCTYQQTNHANLVQMGPKTEINPRDSSPSRPGKGKA